MDLRADLRRFHRSSAPLTHVEALRLFMHHFGLQALVVYRFGRWLRTRSSAQGLRVWAFALPLTDMAARFVGRLYGIYLDPEAEIGPGLYIGHQGGIHLARCHIGASCSIHQRVRICPAQGGAGPRIGNGVWVGSHVRIEGPYVIGDGATIGAGSRVLNDVPARTLVVGDPARVARRPYDNIGIL